MRWVQWAMVLLVACDESPPAAEVEAEAAEVEAETAEVEAETAEVPLATLLGDLSDERVDSACIAQNHAMRMLTADIPEGIMPPGSRPPRDSILQALREGPPPATPEDQARLRADLEPLAACSIERADNESDLPADLQEQLPEAARECHRRTTSGQAYEVRCDDGAQWAITVAGGRIVAMQNEEMSPADREALDDSADRFESALLGDE